MKVLAFLILVITPLLQFAQTDNGLLDELESGVRVDRNVSSAFKTLKIVNLESTKLAAKKDLYFVIAHRFGSVSGGAKEFFGFDQSTIRISLWYGLTKWLTIGGSRSSFQKVYDVTAKYKFIQQKIEGFPVTIVGFNAVSVNTELSRSYIPLLTYGNRLTYVSQILISKKFGRTLSLQIAPTFLHENYVANDLQENSQYGIGGGGRYKISNRVSINADYVYHLNRASNKVFRNPLSLGIDIETGGHVFQVHFTNAQPMYDAGFISAAAGDWTKGDFFFGFNLVRVF